MSFDPNARKRSHTRVPSKLEADLVFEEGEACMGFLENISLRGLFMRTDRCVPVGSAGRVKLHLGGRGHGLVVGIEGVAVRSDENGVGVRFSGMAQDAFAVLQDLVLYNAENREQVEAEMEDLLREDVA